MNKAAITSDWSEIAIYSQEIAADSEEIGTNNREMPTNTVETNLNGLDTLSRRAAMAVNPRFTSISA